MKYCFTIIIGLLMSYVVRGNFAKIASDGLNWQQLQAKAQAENKFIFVECYTSWCGPCKAMDEIFQKKTVSEFVDSHFISARIQMDSTAHDDERVKAWYSDAHKMMQDYNVKVFPTYLFFSPSGAILHRDIGFKDEQSFLELLNTAVDSTKQYYVLLNQFQHGKENFSTVPYLIAMSRKLGSRGLADQLTREYVQEFLYLLNVQNLYDKNRLRFIANAMQSSKERGFNLFFRHEAKIDGIVGQREYAYRILERIIYKEDIDTAVLNCLGLAGGTPDWNKLKRVVRHKYGRSYANSVILDGEIRWYNAKKDWAELARYIVKRAELTSKDTTDAGLMYLNNVFWDYVFELCYDRRILKKAVSIQKIAVRLRPLNSDYVDTYANLLYKAGRVSEALKWENRAMALNPRQKDHSKTFEKMKRGEPTWTGSVNN